MSGTKAKASAKPRLLINSYHQWARQKLAQLDFHFTVDGMELSVPFEPDDTAAKFWWQLMWEIHVKPKIQQTARWREARWRFVRLVRRIERISKTDTDVIHVIAALFALPTQARKNVLEGRMNVNDVDWKGQESQASASQQLIAEVQKLVPPVKPLKIGGRSSERERDRHRKRSGGVTGKGKRKSSGEKEEAGEVLPAAKRIKAKNAENEEGESKADLRENEELEDEIDSEDEARREAANESKGDGRDADDGDEDEDTGVKRDPDWELIGSIEDDQLRMTTIAERERARWGITPSQIQTCRDVSPCEYLMLFAGLRSGLSCLELLMDRFVVDPDEKEPVENARDGVSRLETTGFEPTAEEITRIIRLNVWYQTPFRPFIYEWVPHPQRPLNIERLLSRLRFEWSEFVHLHLLDRPKKQAYEIDQEPWNEFLLGTMVGIPFCCLVCCVY